ncbi:Rha family transcriptional regulator [Bacillus sp. FJAT-22090]|uniref:Rha family transcriptional regulator n=1 Tax=Bacillus sp. FJAT-22090 TaxID=1581038 RepID=UPI0006AF8C60|nr:Rha family transcriptional regulator [Bacillus sp. FJAT-22090]
MKQLEVINEQLVIDSRDVAEMIQREHNGLMKTIRGYIKYLTQGDLALSDFFIESKYKDKTGRAVSCFLITRKGCHLVANKMTGEKGLLFTAAYVTRFDEMERGKLQSKLLLENEQLKESINLSHKTSKEVEFLKEEMQDLKNKVQSQITLDHSEQRRLQSAISSRVLSRVLKYKLKPVQRRALYTELHREIKDRFGVSSYKDVKRKELKAAIQYVKYWFPREVRRK